MLLSLGIRDLAVIERIHLDFREGLTVLTGETGAGKSILLDALGLAAGRRADAALVRPGCSRASVAATFSVSADAEARALLDERGIDAGGEIVVRRRLGADGRSRAFVNDEPVGVAFLADLGERLVEVHGQHDRGRFLKPETHRAILDAFGGHDAERRDAAESYRNWREARHVLERAAADEETLRERREELARGADELETLAPEAGEDEALAGRRSRLSNAQKIAEALTAAAAALEEGNGVEERLRRACAELARVREAAAGAVDEPLAALDRALLETNEAAAGVARAGRELEADPGELERVEERLFALRAAARRHRTTVDGLPEARRRLAAELAALDDGEGSLKRLREAEAEAAEAFERACARLSESRSGAARALDRAVSAELEPLRMAAARFSTSLPPLAPRERRAEGAERVVFQVVTTPGAPPGPLNRIASGGELSRFMLAIEVAIRSGDPDRTLIFDEIDAGVGGAVSDAVGKRLHRLARGGQVLVVTHAPQVAARADRHIRLSKDGDGASVAATATPLDAQGRREELARMLAGARITEAARAAADSLLRTGTA